MADKETLDNGKNENAAADAVTPVSADPNLANPASIDSDVETEQKAPASVIRVGRNNYAVGLFWQPLQDVDDPISEIRETMESDERANLYAIHYGRAPQYGIGRTDKGHAEGQIVGAVAVLDALSDKSSFVAVFEVDEGWWFLAARNDLILPEEDVLYHTEKEAKDAFYSMMAVPDWGYKIAPASWNIDDTEEMHVEDLLKTGVQVRLYSLSAIRGMKIVIGVAFLVLLLIAGAVYSFFFFREQKEVKETVIETITPQVTIQPVEPKREEEKPWEKLVSVPDFLHRCWISAYQLKTMDIPGWSLKQIVCTPEGISTGWTKGEKTRIAWLETAIKEQYKIKGDVQVNETATEALINIPLTDLSMVASTPMYSVQVLRRELTDISQALNLPIQMSVGQVVVEAEAPQQQKLGKMQQQPQAAKVYSYLTFAFSSAMDPPAWESFFKPFSALEVTKIEYNPGSDSALTENWKYEGRIFEINK